MSRIIHPPQYKQNGKHVINLCTTITEHSSGYLSRVVCRCGEKSLLRMVVLKRIYNTYFVFVLCCQFSILGLQIFIFLLLLLLFFIVTTNFFYAASVRLWRSLFLFCNLLGIVWSSFFCLLWSASYLNKLYLNPCPISLHTVFPLLNLILVIQNSVFHRKAWRLSRR